MATMPSTKADELEDRLAELALEFRQAEPSSSQREAIAFQYGKVFADLIKSVGQFVEPDFDSLLPDGFMPAQYEDRKAFRKFICTLQDSPWESEQASPEAQTLLSPRQLTILRQLVEGRSAKECAELLGISTSKFYKERMQLLERLAFRIWSLPASVRDMMFVRDD